MSAGAVGAGVAPPNGGEIQCEVEDGNNGPAPSPAQNGRVRECAARGHEGRDRHTGAFAASGHHVLRRGRLRAGRERHGPDPAGRDTAQQLPQGQTPPFTTTLVFPAEGGTQSVFIDRQSECTVSETPPPGCTLTFIDPETTQIESPILYPVTVSNNCDPPVEPAVAVVEVPRFTG
jgi:hypothetical protein